MPELPEVESVARDLDCRVRGRQILAAQLLRPRLAPEIPSEAFTASLSGSRINFVYRRGKNILFDLNNGKTLLTHLRMSGRFMLLSADDDDPKFTHAALHFEDATRLVFDDQRHFGLMKILDTSGLELDRSIATLAPEPFSSAFSVSYLAEQLKRSNRSLKEFLLDQTKVCGLGNIYASEAMFRAGISPRRRTRNVPRTRVGPLHANIVEILADAIELARSKKPHPVIIGEGVYGTGAAADWKVYDREAQPCKTCASAIRRIRQGQRSTYYCPKCQR